MTIFDLLFLVLVLFVAGALIAAAIAAVRGRRASAIRTVRRTGILLATYGCVLLLVSALTPQRTLGIGDQQCSDDWCIAVQSVLRDSAATGFDYAVTLRLSSRARRVAQRERFVAVHLRDARGRRYAPASDPAAVPFDTLLRPGEAVTAVRRFRVPAGVRIAGLVVSRAGAGRFPGCCIIGDEESFLHQRTIVRLEPR